MITSITEPTWLLYGKKVHCYQALPSGQYRSVCGKRVHPFLLKEPKCTDEHCKMCDKFLGIE